MGGSHGGYATLVGLTFTPDAFGCGVDIVGPSNLSTPCWPPSRRTGPRSSSSSPSASATRTESGKQLLAERSPISHVDKISKPLLIGQGRQRPARQPGRERPDRQGDAGEEDPGHLRPVPGRRPRLRARPENNKAFNAVTEGFLGQCLGGRSQPIGSDFAGSSIQVPAGADGVPGLAEAPKSHTAEVKK